MIFDSIKPSSDLSPFIKSYWFIDSMEDKTIQEQKIVPDGYPEIICHFGDSYQINIAGGWEAQAKFLLAGQHTRHFYLKNTGFSKMIGIKMQPTALNHIFKIKMDGLVNRVEAITPKQYESLYLLLKSLEATDSFKNNINLIELFFRDEIDKQKIKLSMVDEAVDIILRKRGDMKVNQITEQLNISNRTLERQFLAYIGLSPKKYSRIIRLKHIFEQIQKGADQWMDITFDSGFFDQAHFIKDFKEFTGNRPSDYGFNEDNMANFFMLKQ